MAYVPRSFGAFTKAKTKISNLGLLLKENDPRFCSPKNLKVKKPSIFLHFKSFYTQKLDKV